MRIYLAARYSTKPLIAHYAKELRSLEIEITSSWHDINENSEGLIDDAKQDYLAKHARIDLDDIRFADALLLFSVEPTLPMVRGGRHVEFGYALALRKTVIVCGPKENIFHYLPEVVVVPNWAEAKQWLVTTQQQDKSSKIHSITSTN